MLHSIAKTYAGWRYIGIIMMAGFLVIYPRSVSSQTQDAEKLLKELEKLEAKAADPRLRPAVGKPVIEEAPVQTEPEKKELLVTSGGLIDTVAFEKLSSAQQKLIVSYDNFVSLFPQHERVPELLYNTGARYFEVELYPNARSVYQRVLDNYPQSGKWYVNALADMVESYRRENDFKNLEMWSERLRTDPNAPDSLRDAGERLAAGAIANQASELARQSAEAGDDAAMIRAAEEYIRTARTYPQADFASISLYNAGYTYKKAKVLDKAAEVWLDMVERYPQVSYADTAMWNAALAYDELKQYDKALGVYEQFVERYPNSEFRVDALKNSIFDYGETQNWRRAAETYEQYSTEFPENAGPARSFYVAQAWLKAKEIEKAATAFDRFEKEDPKNPKVNEVQFELGQAWIKQGELEKANLSFARFARQNPNNPLSVKIQYDVGDFYYERQNLDQARTYFLETIKVSEGLEKKGLDGNAYYRAEAYMRLASMELPAYEEIKLTPRTAMDANLARKKELGVNLRKHYDGVIISGSIRGAEAAYKISELYENMANAWLAQEPPAPEKDPIKRTQQIQELNGGAVAFLEEAISPLVTVNIKRAGDYADIKYDTTWTATRDSILAITKRDSTESQWVRMAKQKVIEHTARIADLQTEDDVYLVDHFYEYVPVPKPTKEVIDQMGGPAAKKAAEFLFSAFAYTAGLDTLGAQILRNALPPYQRVADLAKPEPAGYRLSGPEITRAHEKALQLAMRPVLMSEARIAPILDDYERLSRHWVQLTDSLMYKPETIRDGFSFADRLYAVLDSVLLPTYVDEALKLTRDMSIRYDNVIQQAEEMGMSKASVDSLKIRLVRLFHDTGMRFHQMAKFAEQTNARYFNRIAQIDSIAAAGGPQADKFIEAEASFVLNEMITLGWEELNFNLRNATLEVYEAGYGYKDIYPVAGDLYSRIRTRLTELDPQLYPPPSDDYRFELTTGASWMVSSSTPGNTWTMSGFTPDVSWKSAQLSSYPVSIGTLTGLQRSRALSIWGAGPDSSGAGADTLLYARRELMVYGTPDSAVAIVAATGPFELFINGLSAGKVDEVNPETPYTFNVTGTMMAKSRNVIGVVARGSATQQGGLVVDIRGVDRVPQAAENMNEVRDHYRLPADQRR